MISLTTSHVSLQRVAARRLLSQAVARADFPTRFSSSRRSPASLLQCMAYDRRDKDDSQKASLYTRALPRISVPHTPLLQLSFQHPSRHFSAATDDESRRPGSVRQRVRDRAHNYREGVRDRASTMRESARDSYRDFREHPAESMRTGAKGLSGMMRKYGPVFVGTYLGVYLTTLGSLFAGVQSGLLDPAYLFSLFGHVDAGETVNTVDLVVNWMKHTSFTEPYAPWMEERPYLANFAVSWIAVKFTEPIRMPVAIGLTPRVSRFLGYSQAPPPPPEADVVEDETEGRTAPTDKKE